MFLMVTAPPGPPPDFRADVVSDDSITLRWESSIVTELIYEICNGTSPVCEDPLVSACGVVSRGLVCSVCV